MWTTAGVFVPALRHSVPTFEGRVAMLIRPIPLFASAKPTVQRAAQHTRRGEGQPAPDATRPAVAVVVVLERRRQFANGQCVDDGGPGLGAPAFLEFDQTLLRRR